MRRAVDVMTRDVVRIRRQATVADAMLRMKERNVTSLLVERDSPEDSYGFMSQRDVITKVVAKGLDPAQVRVAEIMSKPIITVSPETSLQDCAMLMDRAQIRRVLVYDGRDVVGIVSSTDIFNVSV